MEQISFTRRSLLVGAATFAATHAIAQGKRALRIVVPGPAGSAMDALARGISAPFGRSVGHGVVVDNLPGAGGTLATAQVARSAPDGFTLEIVSSNHVINPSIFKTLPYDTIDDFSAIAIVGVIPMVLAVSPKLGVRSVQELVARAKARPGQLNYGSLGIGTVLHLAGELLASEAGISITHVPYKDAGGATTDLASGRIDMAFLGLPTIAELAKAGKVQALAVTTVQRSGALPQVPSISETLPGYALDAWIGLIGPKGIPAETLERYFQAVGASLDDPATREAVAAQGLTPMLLGPAKARAYLIEDMRRNAELVRRAGVVAQ